METVIKPNDIIEQILAIAAELTPVAEHFGAGDQWRTMLTTRDPKDFMAAADTLERLSIVTTPEGKCGRYVCPRMDALSRVAFYCGKSLEWGCSKIRLRHGLSHCVGTRAYLEPLLAKLREVPA